MVLGEVSFLNTHFRKPGCHAAPRRMLSVGVPELFEEGPRWFKDQQSGFVGTGDTGGAVRIALPSGRKENMALIQEHQPLKRTLRECGADPNMPSAQPQRDIPPFTGRTANWKSKVIFSHA